MKQRQHKNKQTKSKSTKKQVNKTTAQSTIKTRLPKDRQIQPKRHIKTLNAN
jgi:hypothetical protein